MTLESLAIFGAQPALKQNLHVGRPNIGDRQRLLQRFQDIVDGLWLTNGGPYLQQFEKSVAQFLGVKHCIGICNATVALEIAIRALGLKGEVIVPSFTFIATAHALKWQEITPVFCDIDPRTHNIDPDRIEELITPETTGILGVHLWGRPCDIDRLEKMAERRELKLLFDSAHAFGSSYKGRMIGNFGGAEVFSFHATKFFNTFEGGAVVTNDDDLAEKIRLMHNFGFAGYDKVIYLGTNGKMSEVAAAMGLTNLESVKEFIAINRDNYQAYVEALTGLDGVSLIQFDDAERNNYQYVVVELDRSKTEITRDQLIEVLWAENILARRYFSPGCHNMEPYRSLMPDAARLLPETERLAERVLVLPTGTSVNREDIKTICAIIRAAVENGKELTQKLAERRS